MYFKYLSRLITAYLENFYLFFQNNLHSPTYSVSSSLSSVKQLFSLPTIFHSVELFDAYPSFSYRFCLPLFLFNVVSFYPKAINIFSSIFILA